MNFEGFKSICKKNLLSKMTSIKTVHVKYDKFFSPKVRGIPI